VKGAIVLASKLTANLMSSMLSQFPTSASSVFTSRIRFLRNDNRGNTAGSALTSDATIFNSRDILAEAG
jgi:hypothetical protein